MPEANFKCTSVEWAKLITDVSIETMERMLRAEVEHVVLQDGLNICLTKEDAGSADFNTMRKHCLIAFFPHSATRSEQEEAMK